MAPKGQEKTLIQKKKLKWTPTSLVTKARQIKTIMCRFAWTEGPRLWRERSAPAGGVLRPVLSPWEPENKCQWRDKFKWKGGEKEMRTEARERRREGGRERKSGKEGKKK